MSATSPPQTSDLRSLFLAEESRLLHFARHLSNGDFAAAQDLVQEAFLRLHAQGAAVAHPRAWLFTAIRNLAFNQRRKLARFTSLDSPAAPAFADAASLPSEQLEHDEILLLVRLCLDELPPLDRLLVKLKFEDSLSYADIARASGLSPSNVGFRLHSIIHRITDNYQHLPL